jgi:hypothetical protein
MKKIILIWLSLILIFLLTARLGWWPVSATAVPPKWESKLAQTTLQAALSHQAAGLTNPLYHLKFRQIGKRLNELFRAPRTH